MREHDRVNLQLWALAIAVWFAIYGVFHYAGQVHDLQRRIGQLEQQIYTR